MRRILALPLVATLALACQDSGGGPVGPEDPDSPEDASIRAHVSTPGGDCLDDATGVPGEFSPCDGGQHGGTPGFYFLPPLVSNPTTSGAFFGGLESYIDVDVLNLSCPSPLPPGTDCADVEDLSVTVDPAGLYIAPWKLKKKGAGAKPSGSEWRIFVSLSIGGTSAPLGYRDVEVSDDPSQDQPADDPVFVLQNGSNVNIKLLLEDGLLCTDERSVEVQCLIDFGEGGSLTLLSDCDPNDENCQDETTLLIGPEDPSFGLRLVTATDCAADVDVDVPVGGSCVNIDVDPPFSPSDELFASYILFCDGGTTAPFSLTRAAVHAQSTSGTRVLPPVLVDCSGGPSLPPPSITGLGWPWLETVASIFRPRPLVATLSHGGGGGFLGSLGTDFQLGVPSAMAPYLTPLVQTVAPNSQASVKVKVTDHDALDAGQCATGASCEVEGATVHFFSDAGSTIDCFSTETCTLNLDGSVSFVTGSNGIAEVLLNVGTETAKVWALGCAIGVDGTDAPGAGAAPVDEVPDMAATCDRDPSDFEDPENPPASPDPRGANGPLVGIIDPFVTPAVEPCPAGINCDAAVAINDLPIQFTAEVCGAPTVNGMKGATEWSEDCVESADFSANLSGGNSTPATVYWTVADDPASGDPTLYLAVEVARDGDQKATSVSFEFDAGNGMSNANGSPDANDDLLLLDKGNKTAATGDFSDLHLTPGCAASSGSSICGDPDLSNSGTEDGAGAVQFNGPTGGGGFLFYELKHPLCTGDTYDFCLTSPDQVGFFLRLAMGSGAQGKTIWPGLNDYDGTDETPPQSGPPIVIP